VVGSSQAESILRDGNTGQACEGSAMPAAISCLKAVLIIEVRAKRRKTARVVTWNGKDVPPELRELPAGRYVVESVDDEAPTLSPEEDAGIEVALKSHRQGRVIDTKRAREIIDAALGRR